MAIEINLNDVASASDLTSHELDVNNPHAVTKTQVGLSDVDNTSDVNKPISSATQTALNAKEDVSNKQTDLTPSATKYPTVNAVNTGLSGKLNDIAIDSTPTASSTNLVTSGGVFTGLGTKQSTLVSGTNIKTVNGNTLLGSGDLVISGGGGTPAGITGQIQFNNAGAFGADSGLFWDNTNKRLGIGATPATNARLDIRAQGALSTDIAFRVRNSADNLNFLEIRGDNQFLFTNNSSGVSLPFTVRSTDNNAAPYIRAISNGDISEASLIATRIGGSGVSATGLNRGFVQLSNGGGNLNVLSSNGGFAFSAQPVSAYNTTSDQMRLLNGNLSIGTGYTGTARLDVRAQGALSTDIAFRVRNSANSANLIEQRGNGSLLFSNSTSTYSLNPRTDADGFSLNSGSGLYGTGTGMEVVSNQFLINNSSVRTFRFTGSSVTNLWEFRNESGQLRICPTSDTTQPTINLNNTNVIIGGLSVGTSATKTFAIYSGAAPTTSPVDAFQQYSADIVAGNASPHFRTENGSVIKLYQNAAVTTSQGIANALTNLGVLASSTIETSIPTHDGATYDTNAIQTVTAAEYAALTPNASTIYFII